MLLEESFTKEDSNIGSCCELALDQTLSEISERNTEKVKNIALAAMRYGIELRAAAPIATVAWIADGVITHGSANLQLIITKSNEHKKN